MWSTAEEGVDGASIYVNAPKYKGLMAILFRGHPALRRLVHKDPEPESDEHPNQDYLATSDFLPYFWDLADKEVVRAKLRIKRLES